MQQQYNRPRRPDPNTISYLRSLPLDEKFAHEEIQQFLSRKATKNENQDERDDYPQSFLASLSAIDEVEHEVASLAGDEFGSQCIELLTRIGAAYSELAARKLLRSIQGYLYHLSIHRFGSHVVQTILEYSLRVQAKVEHESSNLLFIELDKSSESSDTDIPSLKQLLILTVEELCPWANQLSTHICGSHVLRTLICILCGVEIIDPMVKEGRESIAMTRRSGRNKKKGKTESTVTIQSAPHTLDMKYTTHSRLNIQEQDVCTCRAQLCKAIMNVQNSSMDQSHSLQHLACHVYSGPLLSILLRGLVYFDARSEQIYSVKAPTLQDRTLKLLPHEPTFMAKSWAEKITKQLLRWDSPETSNIIYSLAGDPKGSHVLETILRVANDSFHEELCQVGSFLEQETMQEYMQHDIGNFVIQTFLCTVRTRQQAEQFIDGLDNFIQNAYVLDTTKKRRGILWRIVELSARFTVGQEKIIESMRKGFSSMSSKKVKLSLEECIPKLLQYQAPTKDGERIQLEPSGARTLYHFLRFAPRLSSPVINGVLVSYSPRDLELLACDSLASVWYVLFYMPSEITRGRLKLFYPIENSIFDGILDGPIHQHSFVDGIKRLLEKLEGRWVSLALHHIGHHIVKKVFHALESIDDKAILASELSKGIVRLNTKSCGRIIIVECAVKDFLESKSTWYGVMSKRRVKATLVEEILTPQDSQMVDKSGDKKRKNTNKHGHERKGKKRT